MVAVAAVVANHLCGGPTGGFVGVDVFFVISGYLITGMLLHEGQKRGRISLIGFYKRRIRRLFPAALTVTIATVLFARLLFGVSRAHDVFVDALWATGFAANWRMIQTGTDYFQSLAPPSPLEHYWSLSVEEQFYVVWPALLLAAFLICRKFAATRARAALLTGVTAAIMLTVSSLGYSAVESSANGVVAYFSTFTRAWELGLGAVLAIVGRYMRGGHAVLTALSWSGMALIVISLFVVNQSHFPFPGAVLPCLGSALVIIAASPDVHASNIVLTNPVATYIGDISYSIYLVHFPVIIFLQALFGQRVPAFYVTALGMIVALSVMLFHGVESPIRNSRWLLPRGASNETGPGLTTVDWRRPLASSLLLAAAAGAVFVIYQPDEDRKLTDVVQSVQAAAPSLDVTLKKGDGNHRRVPSAAVGAAGAVSGPTQAALTSQIAKALQASVYPHLAPPPGVRNGDVHGLCELHVFNHRVCTFGSGSHVLFAVGDSTSVAYDDAFIRMMQPYAGWRVRLAGGSGCAFADVTLNDAAANQFASGCPVRNEGLVREIRITHPDLLVVTDVNGGDYYNRHVMAELAKVKDAVGRIVMMPAPPQGVDPRACYSNVSAPVACVSSVTWTFKEWLAAERDMASELGGVLIDPEPWFCVAGYCPIFVGHTPVRWDSVHMTAQYAGRLGPVMREAFIEAGLLKRL